MKLPKILLALIVNTILFWNLLTPAFAGSSLVEVSLIPPTFSFQKNLQLKDNNVDVFFLQIILNTDPDTAVSDVNDAGSPGKETTYFGGLTRNAVIKFQNKYRATILTPLGLSEGTGYVGPSTRIKLNEILVNLRANSTTYSTSTTSTLPPTTTSNNGGSSGSTGVAAGIGAGFGAAGSAASSQLLKPFGGQVNYVDYYSCSCSGGILVWIQDKIPPYLIKRLVYQPGVTRLNAEYNLFVPGVETVGSYTPIQTICLAYTGNSCTQQQNDGLITPSPFPGVGTTLSPVSS